MPKVSVITINFNDRAGLERTVESVLNQNCKDFEYILVDGGSTDGSPEVIRKVEDRLGYWVSEKDSGIFHAQNKGAAKAKGEYLLFLNSGDVFENPNVIEKFIRHLHSKDLVFGDLVIGSGNEKRERIDMPDKLGVYYFMISSLAHPVTFIARPFFEKLGGFRADEFRITGDYEFFLRAVLVHNASYLHIPELVALFDASGLSSNPAHHEKHLQERKKSWSLNFSEPVIVAFEEYTSLLRSTELKVGKLIKNVFKPFKAR